MDPPPAFPDALSVEVDHRDFRWKGGSDALTNLQLAHRRCNQEKGGGPDLSPKQQLQRVKAFLLNCVGIVRISVGIEPLGVLQIVGDALARMNPLFTDLGMTTEALVLIGDAVDGFRKLCSTHGDAYLPHLAVCQTKNAEILRWAGRDNEALGAATEADQLMAKLCRAMAA